MGYNQEKFFREVPVMDNALNEKLDLSALHLGIISVGALLGAV